MKIVRYSQKEICYMWKESQIKLERNEVWGDPKENEESLLNFCREFSVNGEDETAHVFYLYGQGGVGKTFACREIAEKLRTSPFQEQVYVVMVDLQRQKSIEDSLKGLADEIAGQMDRKDLFPRFHMVYYSYKMKKGERTRQEERTTKWEDWRNNSSFNLAVNVAGHFSLLGSAINTMEFANEGYKWLLKMWNNARYKAFARQIETMEEEELRESLVRYFAMDFCEGMKKQTKEKKKFTFLLDSVEIMRYRALRGRGDEDYLEWLAGSEGLFRLLPNCLWMLFGRDEISWKKYDREWETTFVLRELERPSEKAVREYLLRQLGQGMPEPLRETEKGLCTIVDEITHQTEQYLLAIEHCVDAYFRIWNSKLSANQVIDPGKVDCCRPSLEEMQEMLTDSKGQKVISSRLLKYYTLQEREILYTLVCLEKWTDEILETLLWKGSVNCILIYEEMCATSFISVDSDGSRSVQGLMLDVIMEECPQRLKKKLLSDLLEQMRNRETDAIFFLLFKSAIHIIRFCPCDESVWEQIGVQFGRGVEYLSAHAEFYSLEEICERILETAQGEIPDTDLYNAAGIGRYFCLVFCKDYEGEELGLLRERKNYGPRSLQLWKIMWGTASEVGACAQAYEIAEILDKQLSAASAGVDYYWVLRQKAELMQKMGDRFDYASIEAELDRICKLALEWEPGKPMLAEKQNIRLWAEYYFFGRPDLRGEEGAGKIGECVEKYRQCCTEEEAEGDVGLCVLETMQERKKNGFILNVTNEWALKGMRILEKEYGSQAIEQPDAQALFRIIYTAADMTRDERELYRRFFKLYYRSFYIAGNWRVYPMLKQGCSFGNAGVTVNNEEEEWGRVGLLDIVQQGIAYLSNHGVSNGQNPLKLLLCYHLFGDNNISTLNLQAAMRKALNNQVLLHFVHTILESGHEERQMLDVLLKAVFGNVSFRNGCFGLDEKRQFLNLLKMCGLEMDRTLWKAVYTGDTDKEEFWILDAFSGWQWELVLQADVQMTEALLYTIWRLHDGEMEEQVLELLEKRLRNADWKERFWSELMQEAQSEGGEWELHMKEIVALHNSETVKQRDFRSHMYEAGWDRYEGSQYEKDLRDGLKAGNYDLVLSMIDEVIDGFKNDSDKKSNFGECLAIAYFYMPAARDRSMDRFMDGIQKMKKPFFLGGKYFILRAYAYLDDRVGFADYYRENCQEIWKGLRDGGYRYFYPENELYQMAAYVFSLEEEDISRDFCSQLADLIAESVSWYAYTEGILCNLEWMMKYVSFETVWRRERCIKEINTTDYDEIYQLIEKYLSLEELMDIFIAGVWGPKFSDKPVRPQNTEFAFWESKYYLWLREKFGEAGEERLKVEFAELYALKEEFDEKYRDHYIWQVHKIVNEIKDLPVRFQ